MRHLALSLLFFSVGCEARLALGSACDLTSDCPTTLVCRHERCRTACREARDCGVGLRCVIAEDGSSACTLPAEESCTSDGSCPGALLCRRGRCTSECTTDADCSAAGRCVEGSCDELVSGSDGGVADALLGDDAATTDAGPDDAAVDAPNRACGAPMICGDGVLQACDSEGQTGLLRLLLGDDAGELSVLPSHELGPFPWPFEGSAAIPPVVAVAGAAPGPGVGFGVAAYVEGGTGRTLGVVRFPLDAPPSATRVMELAGTSDLRSVALAEDGPSVRGLFVAGLTGAAWSAEVGESSATLDPLATTSPVSERFHRAAIVGGGFAMLGSDLPLFLVSREDPPLALTSERIFRATDPEALGAEDRMVTTAAFSNAGLLDTAGGPGSILVVRDPALFGLGVWHVRRSTPHVPGTNPADDPPLEHLTGFGASVVLGPPTIAPMDGSGIDHVVGFPIATGTRFVHLICPTTAPCSVEPEDFASIASPTAMPPLETRLARAGAGYAYATLAPLAEGPRIVFLGFMDAIGADVPGFDAGPPLPSLLPARASPDEVPSSVAIHAVRGDDAVTILVAVLVRDARRNQDLIWLGGLRACAAR